MMSKFNRWLLVLLAVQLIIVAAIYLLKSNSDATYKSTPILDFEKSQLTKLVITNGERDSDSASESESEQLAGEKSAKAVTLTLQDGEWILPELNRLPANRVKLDLAIGKLMGLKSNWPVATTQDSQSRFKVASDNYQKKIQLFSHDKVIAELFLGTSPGFKKVHLRQSGSQEIYSLELNSYDFSDSATDWLDKALLQINDINKISLDEFSLKKKQDTWTLSPSELVTEGKQLDINKVDALVTKLASFNVLDVTNGEDAQSEKITAAEVDRLTIGADQEYQLTFYKNESDYWVKRNDIDSLFSISSTDYNELVNVDAEKLLTEVKPTDDNTQQGQADSQQADSEQAGEDQ